MKDVAGEPVQVWNIQSPDCCCFPVAKLCLTLATPWTAAHQASLSFIVSQSLLKLTSIELVMPSNHLILCCLLLLLPSVFLSTGSFPMSQHFSSGGQRLELQHQYQSFQWIFRVNLIYDWLVWLLYCPRYSQESSSAPQFESINSLVLSLH